MNALSTSSIHWGTNNHGNRVGKHFGLVVGIKQGHQIVHNCSPLA